MDYKPIFYGYGRGSIFGMSLLHPERKEGAKTINGETWFYRVIDDGSLEITGGTHHNEHRTIPAKLNGKSVVWIGKWAFKDDKILTGIEISQGIVTINDLAFSGCERLAMVTIPASVVRIDPHAFLGCCALEKFVVDSVNEAYKSDSGVLLTKDGRILQQGVNGNVRIPDRVEIIREHALLEEIQGGENAALEFKEVRPNDSWKFMKTVVAFANERGGRS